MPQRWPQDPQDPGYSWFLYMFVIKIIKIDFIGTDGFWNVCHYVSPETPQLIRFIFIYIYTSVGIQYAFEGSSSWHILCWQNQWISTLRHFQYHWKSSLMSLFLMKNWFTRSISKRPLANLTFLGKYPVARTWTSLSCHFCVDAVLVQVQNKISKSSCHYSWWTNSVKPVDWEGRYTHVQYIYIHSHISTFIYAPMYISIPTLGFVY